MDEPLLNLDAKLRVEMRSELKRLHLETNSTFVYVTHDQLEAMMLSTKICHMSAWKIQQYAPPLEVYNNPANLTVANFVGNPTMNFVEVVCQSQSQVELILHSDELQFRFIQEGGNNGSVADGQALVLGLRPEHIQLSENGHATATIYSTLPSGLETIVKVIFKDTILTSVAFGDVDYEVDREVGISFNSSKYLLFDKTSGKNLCRGTIKGEDVCS